MKRFLVWSILIISGYSFAGVSTEPSKQDVATASFFGIKNELKLRQINRQKARQIDSNEISKEVLKTLESPQSDEAAKTLDVTMERIVQRVSDAFESVGDHTNAVQIKSEYDAKFKNYYATKRFRLNEIGDHDYMFEWAKVWHEKIHAKLGDKWCQLIHTHDLFILNYGIPVVRAPKEFDLVEYKDHFAGHMKSEWSFVHHGVAGVVTYWAVNTACAVGTWGLGIVAFACSPIASAAEFVTDKHIAPPLAERIWERNNP